VSDVVPPSAGATGTLGGKLLDGRFRIDRKVGEGGFGVVYQGFHLALGTPVAIKILRYPEDSDPRERGELLSQFLAEAQLLPRLKHPHIVSALDVGTLQLENEETPAAYLVMEWCGSETLKKDLRVRRGKGGRSVDEAWKVARPIIDAIAHAHERGFIHRDIKPANVMLVPTQEGASSPRVIDFGIAKEAPAVDGHITYSTMTRSAHRAFSLPYAAPEQLAGSKTGPWTDVHALALILTELLVDALPYGEGDIALSVIDPKRPTPATHGVDVGPWEEVLARAMSLKPSLRHKNARELLLALEQSLEGARAAFVRAPTVQHPSQPPERTEPGPPPPPREHTERATATSTTSQASIGRTPRRTPEEALPRAEPNTGAVAADARPMPESGLSKRAVGGLLAAAVVGIAAVTVWKVGGTSPQPSASVTASPVSSGEATAMATVMTTVSPTADATATAAVEPAGSGAALASSAVSATSAAGTLPKRVTSRPTTATAAAAPPPPPRASASGGKDTLW
jgi:serine/threonine protein kinase